MVKDKNDSQNYEIDIYRNRELTIKSSNLVKRGLKLIERDKIQKVKVIIGGWEPGITDSIAEYLKMKENYDLKIMISSKSKDILEIAKNDSADIFIIDLNDIDNPDVFITERLENSIQLITKIRKIYKKPVIAFSGWQDEPLINDARSIVDFFYKSPVNLETLGKDFDKCVEKMIANEQPNN